MSSKITRNSLVAAAVSLLASVPAAADPTMVADANLPTNVQRTCTADIAPWFGGQRPNANEWVRPPNGLDPIFADFKNNTRCDFYKWGSQMFLWLTSGPEQERVFNSRPNFYNISVESGGSRQYLESKGPIQMTVRKGKTDDEIELGQAGGGDVLLSKNGSLVYYSLHANDVFATYSTGRTNAQFPGMFAFPNTEEQFKQVAEYAEKSGRPLAPDAPWALAMELKASWVDADTVKDPNRFILTRAVVPVFDRSNPQGPWPMTGTAEKTLAMVGMHVVGTVNSHPEMIWATFEHVDNAPTNSYTYCNDTNTDPKSCDKTSTRTYNSKTNDWTFLPQGASKPETITASGKITTDACATTPTSIVATANGPITPTDNLLVDAWGNHEGKWGEMPQDKGVTSNNTDLASLNFSVLSQLATGDVRGNYVQTGGVWTAEGQIPGLDTKKQSGLSPNLRGSLNLANSSMETYYQYFHEGANAFNPKNCFGCHGSRTNPTAISHIIDAMEPLWEQGDL